MRLCVCVCAFPFSRSFSLFSFYAFYAYRVVSYIVNVLALMFAVVVFFGSLAFLLLSHSLTHSLVRSLSTVARMAFRLLDA